MTSVCKIPHCTNDVECPTFGICKPCYNAMYQAGRKTPSERARRLNNLAKYMSRTELVSGVRSIKRKPVVLTILPGQVRPKLKLVKNRRKLHVA